MKYPKLMMTYCPKCRKHTEQTVSLNKRRARGSAHPMSLAQRHFEAKLKGYTSFPRPNPKGDGKPTKKLDLRFKCKVCGKMHMKKGFRAKKFEIKDTRGKG
jgi:large subunit ribosomal protein L44e